MSYDRVNYGQVEPKAPSMHFLRDPLDCDKLGITVIDPDDGWSGMEHDHADRDHEEVYLLVDGSATLTVEGEEVGLDPGDAVRVEPEATRLLDITGDSQMVIAGAP